MNAPELVDASILRLRQVRGTLADAGLSDRQIRRWLHTPRPRLDNRTPLVAILDGAGREVTDEAQREADQ